MIAQLFLPLFAMIHVLPTPSRAEPVAPESAPAAASAGLVHVQGTITQTGISSLQTHNVGPLTVLDQTSFGVMTGSLDGTFVDDLLVFIRPNGRFRTMFTLTLTGTLNGRSGTLEFFAIDSGQLISPTTGQFDGFALVTRATGGLAGVRGIVDIAGTVDLTTGLSTYSYDGTLRMPN